MSSRSSHYGKNNINLCQIFDFPPSISCRNNTKKISLKCVKRIVNDNNKNEFLEKIWKKNLCYNGGVNFQLHHKNFKNISIGKGYRGGNSKCLRNMTIIVFIVISNIIDIIIETSSLTIIINYHDNCYVTSTIVIIIIGEAVLRSVTIVDPFLPLKFHKKFDKLFELFKSSLFAQYPVYYYCYIILLL